MIPYKDLAAHVFHFHALSGQFVTNLAGSDVSIAATTIATQSRDIPLGTIETSEQDNLLRFTDQRQIFAKPKNLIIIAGKKSGKLRLDDIGKGEDIFEHNE